MNDELEKMDSDNEYAIVDLMDFHLRWNDYRQQALNVACREQLTETEKLTIKWLIAMADRISEDDVESSR